MLETLKEFARHRLATDSGLFHPHLFPSSLFREMGSLGLLGAADLVSIARGQALIAGETGSLGFALAWASQSLVPLALDHYARLPQELKAGVSSGDTIIALAISEPKVGAHPKYLSASAARIPGGWKLDGQKAYVTNGPIASHIAVLAVTAESAGKKAFSLFLLPAASPGLTPIEQPTFDFLRPAQHCGFRLEGVEAPDSALIGCLGQAYADIALPFRSLEDAVGSSAPLAVLARAARLSASQLIPGTTEQAALAFGELAGIQTALQVLNEQVVAALPDWHTDAEAVAIRLVAIRDLARRCVEILRCTGPASTGDEHISRILGDVEKYLDIARTAHQIMKACLGQSYLSLTTVYPESTQNE